MRIWRAVKNHFIPSADNAYRPRLLHRPWLLFFLIIILATEGFLVANLVARQTGQNFLAAVVPAEVIALTNGEREQNNIGDVTENILLENAAQAKAEDMAVYGYFSHTGPDGKTPWQWIAESGYKYQYAGENLAVRFIDSKDVVNAWMQSSTHRENIVKPVYTHIGIGVAQGLYEGEPATYVVQYFASPSIVSSQGQAGPTAPTIPSPVAVTPPTAQVAGAAVAPVLAQNNSFMQSVTRQLTRMFANPQQSAEWVLGTVAMLLVVVLVLTFFMHAQVQPTNLLINGTLVAMLAVSFLTINSRITEGGSLNNQAAGVIEASRPGTVVIGQKAESTGYALFPQVQ
ncbi:MAG: CAP domain-containing protein [bacterium]|nr:CAP domain-containing protein [bacterium]